MIDQKISTKLIFWKIENCMLLSEIIHKGSFAEMVFHLKRLNKSSVQAKKRLTPECFGLHPSLYFLGHPLSTYAKYSERLKFLNPLIRTRACAYQGFRNISFSENFTYVLNG